MGILKRVPAPPAATLPPGVSLVSQEQLDAWTAQITEVRDHVAAANALYDQTQKAITGFGEMLSRAEKTIAAAVQLAKQQARDQAEAPPRPQPRPKTR